MEQIRFEIILEEFLTGVIDSIPKLVSGIIFILLSYIIIKIILYITKTIFYKIYSYEDKYIIKLFNIIIGIILWFIVSLAFLNIVGLGDIAVSIGGATGFIGLGIAYALDDMIADTVAGVYLLRDPDFNIGDKIETASESGIIKDISLRKTRLQSKEDTTIVIANSDVEKKWTLNNDLKNTEKSDNTE